MSAQMTTEEAVRALRADPRHEELVATSYLDPDADAAAGRFGTSAELRATLRFLPPLHGRRVLDLGAGTGVASVALARAGAGHVVSIDPDLSDVVGLRAFAAAAGTLPIARTAALADGLPLADESVDVVYCRQVLHHLPDLPSALRECARVLRPGGWFVAVREHVVDDADQLARFLAAHPVHQLAGGESAWSLEEYRAAVLGAGLSLEHDLGPWDSVVNAFPVVADEQQLARAPELVLERHLGARLRWLGRLPGVRGAVWRHLRRPKPGRLHTFVARKS